MTRIRIKGFKIYKDRHGKLRCYHRATGTPIDLEKHPMGSPEFMAACAAIRSPEKPKTETLGWLIAEYKSSHTFTSLRKNTKDYYQTVFDYFEPIYDTPIKEFDRALVVLIMDKAAATRSWYFANKVKTTISTIFSWGAQRGIVKENPASKIKRIQRPKDLPRANRPWSDEERYAVIDACPQQLLLPLAMMMYMGLDPIDAITARKDQYDGACLDFSRTKTGGSAILPVPAALRVILDGAPDHDADTLAATTHGKPWTRDGLNSTWLKFRNGLLAQKKIDKGLTLKGLRHSHATILGEMGADDRTIADVLAQKTEGMARWYSRDAKRKRKLEAVTQKYDIEEQNRREKVSNHAKKLSNRLDG